MLRWGSARARRTFCRATLVAVAGAAQCAVPALAYGQATGLRLPSCVVSGRSASVGAVRVAPPGALAFEVELTRADARIELSPRGQPHRARVDAPFVFVGTASAISFLIVRDVAGFAGHVHLAPDARVERVRALRDGASLDVRLDENITLFSLDVPCDALALGLAVARHSVAQTGVNLGDGTTWIPRQRSFYLRVAPRARAIRVSVSNATSVRLLRSRVVGAFYEVSYYANGGSSFTGWVHRSELVEPPYGSWGIGTTGGRGTYGFRRSPAANEYIGPATIVPNATVYSSETGAAWARVALGVSLVATVRSVRGRDRVQLLQTEGINEAAGAGELLHFWVDRSSVRIEGPAAAEHDGRRARQRAPGTNVPRAFVGPMARLVHASLPQGS